MTNQDPDLGRQYVIVESTLDLKTEDLHPSGSSTAHLGDYLFFHLFKNMYWILPTLCQAVLDTSNTEMSKTQSLPSRNLQ